MFDVVCSRKASGPCELAGMMGPWEVPGILWELPGIGGTPAGTGGMAWEGPGCGIPVVGVAVAADAVWPVGELPAAVADGPRFIIACQCCSRSLCFCINAFLRSSSARSSATSCQDKRRRHIKQNQIPTQSTHNLTFRLTYDFSKCICN